VNDRLKIADEPLDGVLGRATSALRESAVPAGPPPQLDEATVKELCGRVYRPWAHNFKQRVFTMRGSMKVAAAAVVVAATGLATWLAVQPGAARADHILNRAVRAMANLRTVHIQARMRTIAHDNFEMIGLDYEFVPIEMWKEFGSPARWRLDKQGRVAVMDGTQTVTLIRPDHAYKGAGAGFVGTLMDVGRVLESELRLAQAQGSKLSARETVATDGVRELELTVEAKAQGDLTNDWLKNKYVDESDNRRVYRFAADGLFLRGLQIWVHANCGDVLVFETTSIEYDMPIDPALVTLELPANVIWSLEPQALPDNEKYQQLTPEQTARAFFDACGREDWDEVLKFYPASAVGQKLKDYLGGVEVVSIGKAFKSGRYPGWFVPYEIRFRSGETKKMNLAVRNDNAAKRYVVDGGF
jgi:hypothetical protein